MRTSCPTSAKTTVRPVSWQMGMVSRAAMAAFSRIWSRIFRPTGDGSRARAARMPSTMSSGRRQQASTARPATASVMVVT